MGKLNSSACLIIAITVTLTALQTLAQEAIPKIGPCPSGYRSSSNYCVPNANATHAIIKNGHCPSGYRTSSKYCISNQQK